MKRLITTESVSKGHPDKISDQISDAILDACLALDSKAKVAVETMVKDNTVVLGGEISMINNKIDYVNFTSIVEDTVESVGYTYDHGFNYRHIKVINLIGKQSIEINGAVNGLENLNAGDQGIMFGYASNETPTKMPLGSYITTKLLDYFINENHQYKQYLLPDAKSQVTIDYENSRIKSILISILHKKELSLFNLRMYVADVIKNNKMNLPYNIFKLINNDTNILINPAGAWNVGGPIADCGITGRKIVVDQYGSYCPVGGGAFSGKDYSKVDRSGAYLARWVAKNIVAAGLANECKVDISYAIGKSEPMSFNIDTFGESDENILIDIINDLVDLTPYGIVKQFSLNNPQGWCYFDTAKSHFGNNIYPWEQENIAQDIKKRYKKIYFNR